MIKRKLKQHYTKETDWYTCCNGILRSRIVSVFNVIDLCSPFRSFSISTVIERGHCTKIKIVLVCGSLFIHVLCMCLSLSRFTIRVQVEASRRVPSAYSCDPLTQCNNLYFILSVHGFLGIFFYLSSYFLIVELCRTFSGKFYPW